MGYLGSSAFSALRDPGLWATQSNVIGCSLVERWKGWTPEHAGLRGWWLSRCLPMGPEGAGPSPELTQLDPAY